MATITGEALLSTARNFMECRILLTAAELDLFTLLAAHPLTAAEVTCQLRGDERAVKILLDALTAMELLRKCDGKYDCGAEIARWLAADALDSVLPMVLHSVTMWQRWSELTGLVRGDATARTRAHAPRSDVGQRAFIGAMHVVGRDFAPQIVAAIDLRGVQRLLDVGGASGTYTLAFLAAAPELRATIFDLPDVIELARARCTQAGVAERVAYAAGDFYTDELPGGHDLALLSAIIHQNSPPQNVALYRRIRRSLNPGGRLIVRDHIMNPDRTGPRPGAIFAVHMLAGTEGGNVYTFEECRRDLSAAEFGDVRLLQTGDGRMNGLVEARRPVQEKA
jgi:predicted O-methyltransferase YrrM